MAKRPRADADNPTEELSSYSSPACSLHEFASLDSKSWSDVRKWRKQTRDLLIASRMAWSVAVRKKKGADAKQRLLQAVELNKYKTLGIYWPMRGEIDVRDIGRDHVGAGGVVALPVVVEKAAPVEFWKWTPGMRMRRGEWGIAVPSKREVVTPDALIVPLVGFDGNRYRLGYGGGYYDRTLAAATRRPFCIGLGYAEARLPSIYPQPHDIALSLIVTES